MCIITFYVLSYVLCSALVVLVRHHAFCIISFTPMKECSLGPFIYTKPSSNAIRNGSHINEKDHVPQIEPYPKLLPCWECLGNANKTSHASSSYSLECFFCSLAIQQQSRGTIHSHSNFRLIPAVSFHHHASLHSNKTLLQN